MKESSGFYSHMTKAAASDSAPRKMPQQERSVATVEAIHAATIQVLLKMGEDRLTTVRVAQRAGVSVGTLYQYFPNKQALLFAVLERHMMSVSRAVEAACGANHFEPLEVMVDELVNRYIDAKMKDRDAAVAMYKISGEPGGSEIVMRVRRRYEAAMLAMFQTARFRSSSDVKFMTHMIFLTMAGTIRGHLEIGGSGKATRLFREHLKALVLAYCLAV
jgi:AcrR family transcriptional regulator